MRALRVRPAALVTAVFLLASCSRSEQGRDDRELRATPADEEGPPGAGASDAEVSQVQADTEEAAAGAPGLLTLGEARIWEEGNDERSISIAADGTVRMKAPGGREGEGKVTAAGQLRRADGTVIAHLGPGGVLVLGEVELPITIDEDGVARSEGRTMSIDAQGNVEVEPAADEKKIVSEGCTGPMARTCMLVMFGAMTAMTPE